NLEPVHLTPVGETQNRIVGVGNNQLLNKIFILDRRRTLPASTAMLGLVILQRLCLGIAPVGQSDYDTFFRNQIGIGEIALGVDDFCTTRIAILTAHLFQLFTNHLEQALRVVQNFQKLTDFFNNVAIFSNDLVRFQTRQLLQSQIQ